MAKRPRALACKKIVRKKIVPKKAATKAAAKRGPKPGSHCWRKFNYTPELIADCRRRYEQTAEPITAMAVAYGMHETTVRRLAKQESWVRYESPPRGLPRAAQLLRQAEELEARFRIPSTTPTPNPSPQEPATGRAAPAARPGGGGEKAGDEKTAQLDRLERALMAELASVEAMRAQLDAVPQAPIEALQTARALGDLTTTYQRIQRMRCAVPGQPLHDDFDDDRYADIDAFRDEIARRIEAFVASRLDEGNADGGAGGGAVDRA